MFTINVALDRKTRRLLKRLVVAVEAIGTKLEPAPVVFITAGQSINIPGLKQGDDMSYTVPRDHPDEPYTLSPITVADSEGEVTGVDFTERLESSDTSVVSIDTEAFTFHFGTFGGATVNRIVTYQGNDFIVSSAVFNVTPGALTFSGGDITIPGLTPDSGGSA